MPNTEEIIALAKLIKQESSRPLRGQSSRPMRILDYAEMILGEKPIDDFIKRNIELGNYK